MNPQAQPLSFDNADAVHTGGSYILGADNKAVRDDANSGPLQQVAEGAPGAADLGPAVGVTLAHSEASASTPSEVKATAKTKA